jgi:5-carboxymethyl-2-hydroxymuconate isomerase
MPHLTVEYTNNLAALPMGALLLRLNEALATSCQFEEHDIKSRAVPLQDFLIGTSLREQGFVHAKLSLLGGRSATVKRELSQRLLQALQAACAKVPLPPVQLCVEILEIDGEVYAKASAGESRFAG